MENIGSLILPVLLMAFLLRLMALPIKLVWKLGIHSLCGFLCLWLLNSIAGFTGVFFPLNLATVLAAGFLGLPGIGLLALVQIIG